MEKRPVLFLDSGIGGIPYCRFFHQRNPHERIVYLADRVHFPYGRLDKKELAAILIHLTDRIINTINPKIMVLACNTATLAGISLLRERFPALPLVGTVPAVKPATLASKSGKIGVLGTELTINQPFIREIAAQYGKGELTGIAAPELVDFIEHRFDSVSAEEKRAMARAYLDRFRAAGVDALVLGCTHFLFLLEDFRKEAAPDISVFESVKAISLRIESLLERDTETPEQTPGGENRLLLTGSAEPEASWTSWADRLGFAVSVLGEP
jgi:glutamate racemase